MHHFWNDLADCAPKSPDGQVGGTERILEVQPVCLEHGPFEQGLGDFKTNEVMVAVRGVAVFGNLDQFETEFDLDMRLGILCISNRVSILGAQFGK